MNSLQSLIDHFNMTLQNERSESQMTLGELAACMNALPPETLVQFEDGKPVGCEQSYRGYYTDLSFSDGRDPSTAGSLARTCNHAIGSVYQGYNGGNYTMTKTTPVWRSEYGEASGMAIMRVELRGAVAVLICEMETE